jgi:SAM-dependent methyltransferase
MKERRKISPDLDALMPILIGVWRRYHKLSGPPDALQTREFRSVVEAVKELMAMSQNGKSLVGTDYFKDKNLLGAYVLYQWVVHYQEGLSLIGELPQAPRRVLDVCSGPSPFGFAALRHGALEVIATDQNSEAMRLGGEIAGRYGMAISCRKWNCLKEKLPVEGSFDLIIIGHCLEELFPPLHKGWVEEMGKFIDQMLSRLTPDGYLMIVESSYKEPNRRVLELRDALVKKGVPVQAPCVWRGECPALKVANSPCYAQREFEKPYLIREIQRAASINLSSLKMTYIIFRSPKASWPDIGDKKMYRVISPPVDAFGGKRFYLCGTDGKKQLESRLTEHPIESRAFEYLKRGELISFTGALETGLSIDIVQDTVLHVEAPCGKPVVEINQDL